jgi:hypothetical protein
MAIVRITLLDGRTQRLIIKDSGKVEWPPDVASMEITDPHGTMKRIVLETRPPSGGLKVVSEP